MYTWIVNKLEDLQLPIDHLKSVLQKGDIVFCEGEVGAGKTTLIRELVKAYGILGANSPTFAVHNEYKNNQVKIHHLDLYRLESEEEIESAGISSFLSDAEAVIWIEWASSLPSSYVPRNRRCFECKIIKEGDQRNILWKEM